MLPLFLVACAGGGIKATVGRSGQAQLLEGADVALHTVYTFEVYRLDVGRYHLGFLVGVSPALLTQDYSRELQTGEVVSIYVELLDAFLMGWFGAPMTELEKEIANRERVKKAVNRVRAKRWCIVPPPPPWPAPTLLSRIELAEVEGEDEEKE